MLQGIAEKTLRVTSGLRRSLIYQNTTPAKSSNPRQQLVPGARQRGFHATEDGERGVGALARFEFLQIASTDVGPLSNLFLRELLRFAQPEDVPAQANTTSVGDSILGGHRRPMFPCRQPSQHDLFLVFLLVACSLVR